MTEARKSAAAYVTATALSLAALVGALKLWRADPAVPLFYGGDALLAQLRVKGLFENGWPLTNDSVGAPFGLEMHDSPAADGAFLLILKTLSVFTHNYIRLINVYYFLTFPLAAVSALYVFRRFGAARGPAVVGGVLFASLPYHFFRGQEHLFLASYFLVPLSLMLVLRLYVNGDALRGGEEGEAGANVWARLKAGDPKTLAGAAVCALVGSGGLDYAFFTCYLLLVGGVVASLWRGKTYPLRSAGVAVALVSLALLVNLSPKLLYAAQNGPNPRAVVRDPAHAETFGLKLAQLVLPVSGHRLPWLASLKARYDTATGASGNENTSSSLGLVGASGFLALAAGLLWRRRRASGPPELWDGLVDLNLAAVLLATVGGFGTLFGFLVGPWVSAYNRMSIFIGFLSLSAAVLALTRLERFASGRVPRWLVPAGLGAVLVGGVLDQTTRSFVPKYEQVTQEFRDDAGFVGRVEASLPAGGMVFQLPYSPFPQPTTVHRMSWYDHLRGYLHSRNLRWSYGAMRGRFGDRWQALAAAEPVDDMVNRLAFSGFGGVQVDRAGYPDGGAALEAGLARRLGPPPVVSRDGRYAFYGLTGYAESLRRGLPPAELAALHDAALYPVLETWGKGFYGREQGEHGPFHWSDGSGEVTLMNASPLPRKVELSMILSTVAPRPSWVRLKGSGAREEYEVGRSGRRVRQALLVPPGTSRLKFSGDGPKITPPGDPRTLVFRVEGLSITDPAALKAASNGAAVRR